MRSDPFKKSFPLTLPTVIAGTSALGNLFVAMDEEGKSNIIKEYFRLSRGPVVFDSAGKYGAGLALEVLGNCLTSLKIKPEDVIISNKLGWVRSELKTPEPTFEPGVWKNLKHDAVQKISYDGIIECFEQGNELLQGYLPQMVSVHDPDEYLAAATDEADEKKRYHDILEAYRALFELKQAGKAKAVGVGAKNWQTIQRIAADVPLDWVMIANSLTIKNHPPELLRFVAHLHRQGVSIINSAVFHSGFLVGGNYYDYRLVEPGNSHDDALICWRKDFFAVCKAFDVKPAAACVKFAFQIPGVVSIALSTSDVHRVKSNLQLAEVDIPYEFWQRMHVQSLITEEVFDLFPNSVETN